LFTIINIFQSLRTRAINIHHILSKLLSPFATGTMPAGSENQVPVTMCPSDILSRTVSKLSQITVQILDTLYFEPLWRS